MDSTTSIFLGAHQSIDEQLPSFWRSIILFGDNVASYKFALAQSLLKLAQENKTQISLVDLALPFSTHIVEHIKSGKPQTYMPSSKFLDACKQFSEGSISQEVLIDTTVRLGFNNVIDAFHNVTGIPNVPRFYTDERKSALRGIVLTDTIFELLDVTQAPNLPQEIDARWRLVETAWQLGVKSNLLAVQYEETGEELFVKDTSLRRVNITSARQALNGYQKGKCFYCFRDIFVQDKDVHVDHVFPHILKQHNFIEQINGVWNLVLACPTCNLSKRAQRPHHKYLDRLYQRNEFLINSHHPLRETLMVQTGRNSVERQKFLRELYSEGASRGLLQQWQVEEVAPPSF